MNFKGIHIEIIAEEDWRRDYSENAHLIAFGKHKPSSWDRLDYAMLCVSEETRKPVGYVTCREFDHETVYWQFGGAMPETKGSSVSVQAFQACLEWTKLHYKRVTFVVENTNAAMLKLAQHTGFLIIGVRNFHGSTLVEFMKEFKEAL
jgi:RimJ/RimL family protein N-acetyltransferase